MEEAEVGEKTISEGLQAATLSKPFWCYIKSRKQDNIGVAPLEKNGSVAYDSKDPDFSLLKLGFYRKKKEKTGILLDQFQSIFTRQEDSTPPHFDLPQHPSNNICATSPLTQPEYANYSIHQGGSVGRALDSRSKGRWFESRQEQKIQKDCADLLSVCPIPVYINARMRKTMYAR